MEVRGSKRKTANPINDDEVDKIGETLAVLRYAFELTSSAEGNDVLLSHAAISVLDMFLLLKNDGPVLVPQDAEQVLAADNDAILDYVKNHPDELTVVIDGRLYKAASLKITVRRQAPAK